MNATIVKTFWMVVCEAGWVVLAVATARADEPGYPGVTVFRDDYRGGLAGFQAAAPDAEIAIDFDQITAGTDITKTTVAGVYVYNYTGYAPLMVVRGADTYTPAGFVEQLPAPDYSWVPLRDPSPYKLIPTSGENVLSPGGLVLGPGNDNGIENESLRLVFPSPVSAFGLDILWQSADGAGCVTIFVYSNSGMIFQDDTLSSHCLSPNPHPLAPPGSTFWGIVSTQSNITSININESNNDNSWPDSNIGYDTFRYPSECSPNRWVVAEGDFGNPDNWSLHAVPGADDAVLFTQDGSVGLSQDVTCAAVTVTAAQAIWFLNDRVCTLDETATCGARTSITIGSAGTDPQDAGLAFVGGQVAAGSIFIGEKPGTAGRLALREGCRFNSTTECIVGKQGIADLILAEGSDFVGRQVTLGTQSGSEGAVMVGPAEDAATSRFLVDPGGSLIIGSAGQGDLLIDAQGFADSHSPAMVGLSAGGWGTITVRGRMDFFSVDGLVVGDAGNGLLLVEAGGQVASPQVWLGKQAGSFGEGKVTGTGSKLTTDNLRVGASPEGTRGEAEFSVVDGAVVEVGQASIDGNIENASSLLIVGNSGVLRVRPGGFLVVGFEGTGSLSVIDSGQVTLDRLLIANNSTALGYVEVGAGGSLIVNAEQTIVGGLGNGELAVTTQGSVRSEGGSWIGQAAGSGGLVTVAGAESEWIQSGSLTVGGGGAGELLIQNGGRVVSTQVWLASEVGSRGVVEITGGGRWYADSVEVGVAGPGSVTVADDSLLHVRFLECAGESRLESSTVYVGGPGGQAQSAGKVSRAAQAIAPAAGVVTEKLIIDQGATLQVGSATFAEGGTLGGNGTFPFDVTNPGVVAPGGDQPAIGTFTVGGNYTQLDSGTLAVELGGLSAGNEHDVLAVSGHASLGGTLRVSLINDFVPQPGDRFEVMTFASAEGRFATVDISTLPAGIAFTPEYGPTSVSLLAVQADGSSNAVLPDACGNGACGSGVMTLLPLTLVAMVRWRGRSTRQNTKR